MECPNCSHQNPEDSNFCNECGYHFVADDVITEPTQSVASERKYVTIMFSDMTGYTAMTERLDPEDVKGIMSDIFGKITAIIQDYDGFIERFIGDAVMAVFGVPKAHEDDPIRAIKAAMEIHAAVKKISPKYEDKIGRSLAMHTGINTGLVVTGEVDVEKGRHGLTGDAINLASRLEGLAESEDIVVGPETYIQSSNYFEFEALKATMVRGKKEPIKVYKLISEKRESLKIHRLHGLHSKLTGRNKEMKILTEAIGRLKEGQGSIISISGEAGTGKSRLKKELKDSLNLSDIRWHEGHSYSYTQRMPYYPLISLFTRIFQINESDEPDTIRNKVERGILLLHSDNNKHIPYIGYLFSLNYPEIDMVNPEYWKDRLWGSVQSFLAAIVSQGPTVICFEDLHWSDPSFIELFKQLISKLYPKVLFIITYRSHFSLFNHNTPNNLKQRYQDIQLKELVSNDTLDMLKSLLGTSEIPEGIVEIVKKRAEGNPFYIEEIVNSLIDSEIITRWNGSWKLTREILESDIPATIQGVLSARVDRLRTHNKKVLKEASVIGRAFLYRVLERVINIDADVNHCLSELENLDFIKTQSVEPELEYIFKHALTQAVVYNGLLKSERRAIHECIGLVIEKLFTERLSEFYETLSFHFKNGQSTIKAVEYLLKAGQKSHARYAVSDAHQYFREAYDLLKTEVELTKKQNILLLDILNNWAYTFYYRGEISDFYNIFNSNKGIADSLNDKARLGMFYVWMGTALLLSGKTKDSYDCLQKALELSEASGNQKALGYACFTLTMVCAELGLFNEGVRYGEKALVVSESFPSDQYLFFKAIGGLGIINWMMGDSKKVFEYAELLLAYGEKNSNNRSKVWGHWIKACGDFLIGEMVSSEKNCLKAIEVASDPLIIQFPKPQLALVHLACTNYQEVENVSKSCLSFCEKHGVGELSAINYLIYAPALIAKGNMQEGLSMIEKSKQMFAKTQRRTWCAQTDYVLGKVYSQIATGPKPALKIIARNIKFLTKNAPFASKKAEKYFKKAIEVLKGIGAKGFLGPIYLDLGLLYKNVKRFDEARDCFYKSIQLFEDCNAEIYIKQAKEALDSLK